MDDAVSTKPRRSLTSVDLGDLRPQVNLASAAAGVGPSTWLRDLVQRELSGVSAAAPSMPAAPATSTTDDEPAGVYRAWLDAAATAKLDRLAEAGGFRNRASALRGLLNGVNIGVGANGAAGVAEACQALGLSNHHLVAIARQLTELSKAAPSPSRLAGTDPADLTGTVQSIRKHLEIAAILVGELRPMLKSKKDGP